MCSSVDRSKSKMFTFQTRVHFNYHMYNRLDSHNCLLIYMKINYVYILHICFQRLGTPFTLLCPYTKHRMLYITAFYAVKVCNNLLALTVGVHFSISITREFSIPFQSPNLHRLSPLDHYLVHIFPRYSFPHFTNRYVFSLSIVVILPS